MMYQTTRAEARRRPAAALNMPQQAPPIDRTEAAAVGAPNAAPGVEANMIAPPFLDWPWTGTNSPWTGTGPGTGPGFHIPPIIA